MSTLKSYLSQGRNVLAQMRLKELEATIEGLLDACLHGRSVFLMGNGGSAATASHFANDLNKTAIVSGMRRFRALALTDNVPLITAWANDDSFEEAFAQQMLNMIERGDVVIGFSTSGNSPNVLEAMKLARAAGACTIGFTGQTGGKLRQMVDHCVQVPTDDVMQIEGIHMVLIHATVVVLRERLSHAYLAPTPRRSAGGLRPAVFLDRDGVLNENRHDHVKNWQEFAFLPNVIAPLANLSRNHHAVVIVTNQSAIGRGLISQAEVEDVHRRMVSLIRAAGARVDGVYVCPHRPEDDCECRKPRPGLVMRAAKELGLDLGRSFLIGDALSDVEAALAAGCSPILVLTGRGKEELPLLERNGHERVPVAEDLAEAVSLIMQARPRVIGSPGD